MPGTKRALRCIRSAWHRSIIAAFVHCFLFLDLVDEAGARLMNVLRKEKGKIIVLRPAIHEPETRPRGEAHWLE